MESPTPVASPARTEPVAATELGIVGGAQVVAVSPAGGVHIDAVGAPFVLDWWVGAEDRWHIASREAAVRQGEGADGASIETRLRVPGGDVVHRVAAVPSGGRVLARVELENATPVPVAIAVVVALPAGHHRIEARDDTIVVDGLAVVRAGRSIARFHVGDSFDAALAAVDAGAALPPGELEQPATGSVAVAIFPLAHTAVLAASVAADGGAPGHGSEPSAVDADLADGADGADGGSTAALLAAPSALPPFDAIARGWVSHMGAAARIAVPDDRLLRMVDAARRHLLGGVGIGMDRPYWTDTAPWAAPVAAVALDAWGHDGEALDLLLAATGPDDLAVHATRSTVEAGALAWAWAERLERHPDPELAATVAPFVEQLAVRLLQRRGLRLPWRRQIADTRAEAAWRAVGLAAASSVLSRTGDVVAGADIVDALPELVAALGSFDGSGADTSIDPTTAPGVPEALGGRRLGVADGRFGDLAALVAGVTSDGVDALSVVAARGSVTGALGTPRRGHDPAASALVLLAVRRAVVDEPAGAGGTVAVLTRPSTSWLGGSIEAHALPVAGGTVSFAVRWHGTRPALLWELDVVGSAPELSAPGLDPSWRHTPGAADRAPSGLMAGEALLAATPGLTAEAMESPHVHRGETLDPDDDPGSFA